MVRVLLALVVACLLLSFTAEVNAAAAPKCVNGICAAPTGGSCASGSCGVGHRLTSGGPVRNAVGAVLHGDGPVRRLLQNRPRLLGRLFGRCRGCG